MKNILMLSYTFMLPLGSLCQAELHKSAKAEKLSPEVITQKKEIAEVCEFAESVDLTETDPTHSNYNDNGRIPLPENVKIAITRLEGLIKKTPEYPEIAKAYLLLGKIRRKYQDNYYTDKSDSGQEIPPKEIKEYAETQYALWESGQTYFYNGWHFDQIIIRFPSSMVIDAAVYEKTFIPSVECESDKNCWVDSELEPMVIFLGKYQNSLLAEKAITRANKAFDSLLLLDRPDSVGNRKPFDLSKDSSRYSVKAFKDSVASYANVADRLNPDLKAAAMDKISEAWERAGDKEKAISAAEYIISKVPAYSNMESVKDRLKKIKATK